MIRLLVLFLLLIAFTFAGPAVSATGGNDVQTAIVHYNTQKEKLINGGNFFFDAIDFYHHRITPDAAFNITIHDPRPSVPTQKMQLNKQEYVNAFLQEGQKLIDYDQSYSIQSIEASQYASMFIATESIVEKAVVPPVSRGQKEPIEFTSNTTCKTLYKVENNVAVNAGSNCETYVYFLDAI